ncbi:signal peptidase II [Candidatus Pelagibacter sp. HIMB1483]|uniref:signal peptidase II n=1 Tax=Candidatus Pelagibacter sp. HIMB1483 TaxID=3415414 RepID=UPI003F87FCD6
MSDYINKNLYSNFLIVIIIFALDRISKYYVILLNEKNLSPDIFASKYLNISLIWNQGIAFGLFSFNEVNLYNFLTVLIAIIITIIFFMILRSEGIKKYSLLMILGGALGNLYDRIFYKAVPDFIDFHIGNFHWFIFNVSDIFISLGVLFLILQELIYKQTNEKK